MDKSKIYLSRNKYVDKCKIQEYYDTNNNSSINIKNIQKTKDKSLICETYENFVIVYYT